MEPDVKGPIIDQESGVRTYIVQAGGREVTFGVTAVPGEDGVERWTMRLGADRVVPGDYGEEPYDSPEAAYEAGMRAARLVLTASSH
ncbi:MAG: hypothetical protein ACRDFS_08680 [Chloroflexota bacterium]